MLERAEFAFVVMVFAYVQLSDDAFSTIVLNEPSALNRLAEIHKVVGVSPGMFDTWLQALLNTVEALDPGVDELTELAWCWLWSQA